MKAITFSPKALTHLEEWKKADPKILGRIVSLITDIASTPYTGIGKPEPLKHNLKGAWSRRIDEEHRIVYEIKDTVILILSCRYHY